MNDWFLSNELLIQTIAVYALVAFSVQVPLRSGTFSLAGVGFYGVGSYAAAYWVKDGMSPLLAIAAAIVVAVVVGWTLAVLLVRLRDLYLGIATLAFDMMVTIVALNWEKVTGGAAGMYGIPLSVSTRTMLLTLVVVAVLLTLLETGVVGRIYQTIREDEQLAQALAIDARKYRRLTFVIGCALGALAGAYHSLSFNAISPGDSGFHLVVLALAMVIIGGFNSWIGALLGAVILGWIPVLLAGIGNWWPALYGAGMVFFAVLAPGGIFGVAESLYRRIRSRRATRAGRKVGTRDRTGQGGEVAERKEIAVDSATLR